MRSPHEERYSVFRHDPENPFVCFYCGEPANTLDHQPPLSRVSDYEAMDLARPVYVKVSACEECNSLLGSQLTVDLVDREMLAKRLIENRYRRALQNPEWTQRELDALRGRLREHIENHAKFRSWIERRLEYAGGINAAISAETPVRVVASLKADVG